MHSNFTNLDTLQRLILHHGATIRYAPEWGWLIWNGTHWQHQDNSHIIHCAMQTVLSLFTDIDALPESEASQRALLIQQANRSATVASIKALVDLVRTDPAILTTRDCFDSDPFLLTVNNGTLNLRTGQLKPHDPLDYITRFIPIDYDPRATSSCWDTFLAQITNHDQPLQQYLQRAVGYSLTGSTREDALFLLYGPGCNGKSTFLRALHTLLGTYAQPCDTHLFTYKGAARSNTTLSSLLGARCLTIANLEPGDTLDLNLIKHVTSGEALFARTTLSEQLAIAPRFKLWCVSNHLPAIQEHSNAIWRRLKLIPFTISFADHEIKDLFEHLQLAAPALLAWAVAGCLQWQRSGLQEPPAVTRATLAYRHETNQLSSFIFDTCTVNPDGRVSVTVLYQNYLSWCQKSQQPGVSKNLFSRQLLALGFQREHTWSGNYYRGIALGPTLSEAELPYVDIGINLPADSSPQKDYTDLLASFKVLADRTRSKPAPSLFSPSKYIPNTADKTIQAEFAHLEQLIQRELMTEIPGYPPPDNTPEAYEVSSGNESGPPEEYATSDCTTSNPVSEAYEGSSGSEAYEGSSGNESNHPEEYATSASSTSNSTSEAYEGSSGNESNHPPNPSPPEHATSASSTSNPTSEASEVSRGNISGHLYNGSSERELSSRVVSPDMNVSSERELSSCVVNPLHEPCITPPSPLFP